jgi:hypothetical protein
MLRLGAFGRAFAVYGAGCSGTVRGLLLSRGLAPDIKREFVAVYQRADHVTGACLQCNGKPRAITAVFVAHSSHFGDGLRCLVKTSGNAYKLSAERVSYKFRTYAGRYRS